MNTKKDNSSIIISLVFGLIALALTLYAAHDPVVIFAYLCYMCLSAICIGSTSRKSDNPKKMEFGLSITGAVLAILGIEVLHLIAWKIHMGIDILLLCFANISLLYPLSVAVCAILNRCEANSISQILLYNQKNVYEQINTEYLRIAGLVKQLNDYKAISENEHRRFYYLSLIPGVDTRRLESVRKKAFDISLNKMPSYSREAIIQIGFEKYYQQLNEELVYVRKSKTAFDSIRSSADYKEFKKTYPFIKL